MKKIYLSIIIICLVILLFSSISLLAKNAFYEKYLALGDSISSGYGLTDVENENYPEKVRVKYNIEKSNFKNLSVSGMTCEEFLSYVKTTAVTNAIKETEVMSVSIGSNELLGIITEYIGDTSDTTQVYLKFLNLYDFLTSTETKNKIALAIASYEENWNKSILYIKEINPDIDIVALEFYNPYYGVSFGSYDFGTLINESIEEMNQILWEQSDSQKQYKIAEIYDDFNNTTPRLTNVNIQNFNIDPHPNATGHERIYQRVVEALIKDVNTLNIENIANQFYTGEEIKPQVIIKNGDKQLVENTDYTVSYSNNTNLGEAKILISGMGNYKGTVVKTFNIIKIDISDLEIGNISDYVYTGEEIKPQLTIKNADKPLVADTDYTISYTDNTEAGEAKVLISGIGYYEGTVQKTFNILRKDINDLTVEEVGDYSYTGKEIKPKVTVKDGDKQLIENLDYNVAYSENIEVGQAEILIVGMGNYNGLLQKTFNILTVDKEEIDKEEINKEETDKGEADKEEIDSVGIKDVNKLIVKDIKNQVYTGEKIKPAIVIIDGNKQLVPNTDFVVSYIDNIKVGKAKVFIRGIGNYTGELEKTFNIYLKEETSQENNIQNENILDNKVESNNIQKDNTIISDDNIPQTGNKVIIYVLVIAFICLAGVMFFKYRKYKFID